MPSLALKIAVIVGLLATIIALGLVVYTYYNYNVIYPPPHRQCDLWVKDAYMEVINETDNYTYIGLTILLNNPSSSSLIVKKIEIPSMNVSFTVNKKLAQGESYENKFIAKVPQIVFKEASRNNRTIVMIVYRCSGGGSDIETTVTTMIIS
jgi:hypothetical protein